MRVWRLTCSVLFMLRRKQMSFTRAQISESGLQQFNRLYVWAQRLLKNQITLPRIAWEIKNMQLNTPLLLKGWFTQKWTFAVYLWRINVLWHSRRKRSVARVYVTHSLHRHASAVVNALRTVEQCSGKYCSVSCTDRLFNVFRPQCIVTSRRV